MFYRMEVYRIPETNSKFATENSDGWKMKTFVLGPGASFSGKMLVEGRVCQVAFPTPEDGPCESKGATGQWGMKMIEMMKDESGNFSSKF